MQQILVAAALLAMAVALTAWLRTGRYRRCGETGPLPHHLWVVPVLPFAGVLVSLALGDRPWPVLLPYLTLLTTGVALAAIDADVHRLPNGLTQPLVPVELALLLGASAATGDPAALRRAGLATLLVGGGFVLLSLVLPGRSMGMGDAKLMLSVVPALTWLGWGYLLAGLWLGFVLGGVVALVLLLARRVTRASRLPFGPWLVGGALLAVCLA